MQTIDEFIKQVGIGMTVRSANHNPNMADMPRGSHHYLCTLYRGIKGVDYRELPIPFSQGSAHTTIPSVEDVLDCLASDSSCVN